MNSNGNRNALQISVGLLLVPVVACLLLTLAWIARTSWAASSSPTVTTDKSDYQPGETVTITGGGFLAGEAVVLQVLHVDDGFDNDISPAHDPWQVTADANGSFQTTWSVPVGEDEGGATLQVTATGQASGLSAQTTFTDACPTCFDAQLQGQSFGDTNTWLTGNLMGWQELDPIPVRVSFMNGPVTNVTITVKFDHSKTTKHGNILKPGLENLFNFTPSANVTITSGPTLNAPPDEDVWSYTFVVDFTGGTGESGFVEFRTRMAAGAHNFTGSSMSLGGDPSLGTLQIHKPAPTPGNPDLSVNKNGPALANAGQTISYVLQFANNTNSVATGVQLADVIPPLATFSNCTDGCTVVGDEVIWDLGDLSRNSSGSVSYQVTVSPAAQNGDSFTNSASILSSQDDPNLTNNAAEVITTVTNGCIAPTIAGDPGSVTNCAGGSAMFCVVANGSSPLSFQWRKNTSPLPGETNDCLTTGDPGSYDCVVTNLCGSATSAAATLAFGTAPPGLACPSDITTNTAPGQCSRVVTFTVTATGDPTPTVVCEPASGNEFSPGTTLVTCTASSGCGSTNCSFNVTVIDAEPPSIICPADKIVNADENQCSASNVALGVPPSTNDNCVVAIVTNNAPSSFPVGTNKVVWTAIDGAGNSGSCTQKVIVVDNQPPSLSCPGDITSNAASGQCSAVVTYATPNGSDNCGVKTNYCSPASGSSFNVGTNTVTCKTVDTHGNTNSCPFQVIVVDNQAPSISCPGNITSNVASGQCSAVVTYATPSGSDNCGVKTNYCSPASGSSFNVGTNTVTCTTVDTHCNSNSCTFKVFVVDNQGPTIGCPSNVVTTANAGSCVASNVPIGTATAWDNCGGALTPVGVRSDGLPLNAPYPVCTNTVITWTATDAAGHSNSCTQTVNVKAGLSLSYTGDMFVSTAGSNVATAVVLLGAHITPDANPACVSLTQLQVVFQVSLQNGTSSTLITNLTAGVNGSGDAAAFLTLSVGEYTIVASTVTNNCWGSGSDNAVLTIDYGSNERHVTGGGFVGQTLSENGKANFGFTVGFGNNGNLKGNSIYLLRGKDGFNYLVKSTSWTGGSLSFIADSATGKIYRARFNGKCVIQQINRQTGVVVSTGNCAFVVDIKDGDVFSPSQKDQYAISVFLQNGSLWFGSSPTLKDLGAGGPGGGNVVIHGQ